MLVLSRRRHETVVVGDDVKVTVLDVRSSDQTVRGGQVKLGFQAPPDVCIQRQELLRRRKSGSCSSGRRPSKPEITGKKQLLREAVVQLQFEMPHGTSIHCSRACGASADHQQLVPVGEVQPVPSSLDTTWDQRSIRVIDCRKDDNILVGRQLQIIIAGIFRFVADPRPEHERFKSPSCPGNPPELPNLGWSEDSQ